LSQKINIFNLHRKKILDEKCLFIFFFNIVCKNIVCELGLTRNKLESMRRLSLCFHLSWHLTVANLQTIHPSRFQRNLSSYIFFVAAQWFPTRGTWGISRGYASLRFFNETAWAVDLNLFLVGGTFSIENNTPQCKIRLNLWK